MNYPILKRIYTKMVPKKLRILRAKLINAFTIYPPYIVQVIYRGLLDSTWCCTQ